ncbi:MAG: hypothetical protein AB7T38_10415 [Nitrospirales bacterium]
MSVSQKDLQNLVTSVKQQRDELKLKLHLAKAEAREEWTKLENQWEEVRTKVEGTYKETSKTAEGVGSALELALQEIKKGYERIKKTL